MSKESEIETLRKEMKEEFKKINKILMELIKSVEKSNGSCRKMEDHISFVECTYEKLRSPLDYITDRVNSFRGVEMNQLPETDDSENSK